MTKEEKIEGKDFVIRDKRGFTSEGEAKAAGEASSDKAPADERVQEKQDTQPASDEMPMPEINFSSFVLSLSSSALLHFGQIPDPLTKKTERNLPMAKQTIDILGILKDKTKNNLSDDEEQLLDGLLYDLRVRYVEESKKK
jgi:hypothetical protein